MKFRARPIGFRYAPMIVDGGAVKVMVYDGEDLLVSSLVVTSQKSGGYVISGEDPGRGKMIRTKVDGISAFDAARKYCEGALL